MKKFLISGLAVLFLIAYACQPKIKKSEEQAKMIEKLTLEGQQIVGESFLAIGGQLSKAMQEGGIPMAISYCNVKASPIIDSISKAHNVVIQRFSLKNRNLENLAMGMDSVVAAEYQSALEAGAALKPFIQSTEGDDYIFYAPILVISPLCIQCHGEPGKTIAQADYDLILSKYPGDKAIGFDRGDLRGIWKIRFFQK